MRLEKKWDKGKAQSSRESFKRLDKVGVDRADGTFGVNLSGHAQVSNHMRQISRMSIASFA